MARKILIVDDDQKTRLLLKAYLEKNQYEVILSHNGESFLAYVEQVLAPELSPKNTVILDNLGSHKSQAVRQAIRKTGARLLFLPPYSPDLNPIEQAFAKLKHMLRKARQRSIDTVWKAVGQILQSFLPEECRNYFINAGWVRLNS